MKTLSDFKKELASHPYWLFTWENEGTIRANMKRQVVKVQSNAVAFWREYGSPLKNAMERPHLYATWFWFPKASECKIEGNTFTYDGEGLKLTYIKCNAQWEPIQ